MHRDTEPVIFIPRNDAENGALLMWASKVLGEETFGRCMAFIANDGKQTVLGVFVVEATQTPNCLVHIASVSPRWCSRKHLWAVGDWVFNQLKCARMTGVVQKGNHRARSFLKRIGWKEEGVLRKGDSCGKDLMIYGALKDEFYGYLNMNTHREAA